MFGFNLREYNIEYSDVATYVPWYAMVAPGIIKNEDESFMRVFRFRGQDLDSVTDYELMGIIARVNNYIKRYGNGWVFYIESRRMRTYTSTDRKFPDKTCQLMEYERQNYFNQGNFFRTEYYLTMQWLPLSARTSKAVKMFYTEEGEEEKDYRTKVKEDLEMFISETDKFFDGFGAEMYECEPLSPLETLDYLHSCVSLKNYNLKMPVNPIALADSLCDTPFYGGTDPILGDGDESQNLYIYSIRSYPESSYPGMLDDLNRLDIEYRWMTRFICYDKVDAQGFFHTKRREWRASDKDLGTMVKEWVTRQDSVLTDTAALQRSADADDALVELANDYSAFGYMTSHVILSDHDRNTLKQKGRLIERAFQNQGFVVRRETHNATSAWFGSIPGNAYADPRRDFISTLNLCHLLPLSSVWTGNERCKHLGTPALAQVETVGSTPFFLNLHIGDVGHSIVVGPTGSGKSVFLNFLETQIRSVPDARIYVFDKGGSSRVLSAIVGGSFFDLGNEASGNSQSFQPLRYIDDENEKIWASEWLQEIFVQENITITPQVKKAIWDALESLSLNKPDDRTLSGFRIYIQDKDLRNALQPFVIATKGISDTAGAYGRLFDSDKDTLKLGAYQSFEMGELMNKRNAVIPTLSYLFHRIENDCHGEPTFVILDECWTFLDNPVFASKIREWLKTMRKNNVSIIFATQNLEDIRNCSISSAIIESCMTRFFLPNVQATNPANKDVYDFFSLNDTERNIIASSRPKFHYYYNSSAGRRLFSLALTPFSLSFIGASSKEDQAQCEYIKKHYPPEEFARQWFLFKGQEEAVKVLDTM